MNTLSLTFLCAYLLVLLIYWIIPDRYRNIFLLICSLMYMTLKYGKPYNITYIGRLEHIKGVNLLIGAFAAVCLEHDVRLSIVGAGTERDKLEALVRS